MQKKSLWGEKFSPEPIQPFQPAAMEYAGAVEWVFERDAMGNFCRAGLALHLIRLHSLDLRRRGVLNGSRIAHVALFRRYGSKVKVPIPDAL